MMNQFGENKVTVPGNQSENGIESVIRETPYASQLAIPKVA